MNASMAPRRLILKCAMSPGDIVMLTAAVRDLHRAHPGKFITDVRTATAEIWENNPQITRLDESEPGVEVIDMHYPLIHRSNQSPYHFIHGFAQFLEETLGVRIPVTLFKGDLYLSELEKGWMSQIEETGFRGGFWIMMAGGKYDFTAKWWDPAAYQAVVDHYLGRIQFVQCGEARHWHPPLQNVINLVGQTDTRQFIRLMHHADGVVCPITFAMHLAAAVETKPGKPTNRACVVLAGGREPAHWEAYPHHQFISTNGALPCCHDGGCWKSRCQRVGDGDPKDNDLCLSPVAVNGDLHIPRCLAMIRPDDVIRRIELYYQGKALQYHSPARAPANLVTAGCGV
jgi:ADP-heptose:LPS heptosyltransferase